MNGIRNTYLYVCGSQRLLDIRRIYPSAGLKRLMHMPSWLSLDKIKPLDRDTKHNSRQVRQSRSDTDRLGLSDRLTR